MSGYFNFTVSIEWLAFIAALFILDRKTKRWQLFIVLLFLVLCTETLGWYMYTHLHISNNALPFNILMLISNVFFIWFFSNSEVFQKQKRVLFILIAGFIVFGVINLFFFQGPRHYNSFSESAADIILSILSCYFLFALVKDNEHIDLLRYDYFWFSIGVLFYCLGSALLYQFSDILGAYYKQTKINVGNYINYSLNFILYSSLITAFICQRKATR